MPHFGSPDPSVASTCAAKPDVVNCLPRLARLEGESPPEKLPAGSQASTKLHSHLLGIPSRDGNKLDNHTAQPPSTTPALQAASDGHRQAAMMNRVTVPGLRLRPTAIRSSNAAVPFLNRCYATHHQQSSSASESRRRAVTPFNDDGHVPWSELSAGEKTGRAAQQTFNFGMVIVGLALTVRASANSTTITHKTRHGR